MSMGSVTGVGASFQSALDLKQDVLAEYTYATLPSAASNSGLRVWVTDVGINGGSEWRSDGTDWFPIGGEVILAKHDYPRILSVTGTINTGSSGNLTFGQASLMVYDSCWVYLPAVASTPAITAGWYYCKFTTTTLATIYTSGPGSAAFNFSSGAAYTGVSTKVALYSVPIPAGLLGVNGQLVTACSLGMSSNATARSVFIDFDSTNILTESLAATTLVLLEDWTARVTNLNANYQRCFQSGRQGYYTSVSIGTTSVDTTSSFTYHFSASKAATGTRMEVNNFTLRLIK